MHLPDPGAARLPCISLVLAELNVQFSAAFGCCSNFSRARKLLPPTTNQPIPLFDLGKLGLNCIAPSCLTQELYSLSLVPMDPHNPFTFSGPGKSGKPNPPAACHYTAFVLNCAKGLRHLLQHSSGGPALTFITYMHSTSLSLMREEKEKMLC